MRYLNVSAAVLAAMLLLSCSGSRQDKHLKRDFSVIDTTGFCSVFSDVEADPCNELHSLLVERDGKIIYEKYGPGHVADELHILWSATKTFTATAVGFAVQDGLMSVDDKVVSFFDESELPQQKSEWLEAMTVKNLLTMSSGFAEDRIYKLAAAGDTTWAKLALDCGLAWEPGTRFAYNSMNSYLLSVIVSKVVGMRVADYLEGKLFEPLGIRRKICLTSPQGYDCGGWGFFLTSESLAKMGQFFLNRGSWNGKQLLDAKWFDDAMSAQVLQYQGVLSPEKLAQLKPDESNQGYGYQMWCCTHGAYRLDGAWGQFVVIIPEKNAVVVATSHSYAADKILQFIWSRIYPAL